MAMKSSQHSINDLKVHYRSFFNDEVTNYTMQLELCSCALLLCYFYHIL